MKADKLASLLIRVAWATALTVLLLVAAYISLGRVILPRLTHYQQPIEAWLSKHLDAEISTGRIAGYWHNFGPGILLQDVKISGNMTKKPSLHLGQVEALLDIPGSLQHLRPVFSFIKITDSDLPLQRDEQGHWTLAGLAFGADNKKPGALDELLKTLVLQRKILLRDIQLQVIVTEDVVRKIIIESGKLQCTGSRCAAQTELQFKTANGPSRARLMANISNSRKTEQLDIEAYAELEPIILEDWLPLAGGGLPLEVPHGEVGGRVWLNIEKGVIHRVQGDLQFSELQLLAKGQQLQAVENLSSQFYWLNRGETQKGDWTLMLKEFGFEWGEWIFGPTQLHLDLLSRGASRELRLAADSIDLGFAVSGLMAMENMPQKTKTMLQQLNPRGELSQVQLSYRIPAKNEQEYLHEPRFEFESKLKSAAVSAWKHIPEAAGVTGYLDVTPGGGQLVFASEDLKIHFPQLYSRNWSFSQASGLIRWHNEGRSLWLNGSNIRLETGTTIANGQFSLSRPDSSAPSQIEPRLDIKIDVQNSSAQDALSFIPDRKLNPGLISWLNGGLQAGIVNDATFIYSGSILKGAPMAQKAILLDARAHQLDLNYHKEWPALSQVNARIFLSGQNFLVESDRATLMGSQIKKMIARYGSTTNTLQVEATLEGPLRDLLRTMQETPIRAKLFDLVDDFKLSGDMGLELGLELPLNDLSLSQVEAAISMQNSHFAIPSLNLVFENASAKMNYSTQHGLSGSGIAGQFLGEPFTATISSQQKEPNLNPHGTEITVHGTINSDSLRQWQKAPIFSRLQGSTPYQVQVNLGAGRDHILINADLSGMQVLLPAPYGKEPQETVPLELEMELTPTPLHRLQYGDLIRYLLKFDGQNYTDGQIKLGGEPPVFTEGQGISMVGKTSQLDYNQWDTLIQELGQQAGMLTTTEPDDQSAVTEKQSSSKPAIDYLKQVKLNVHRFYFNGQELQDLSLKIDQSDESWMVNLRSPVIKGVLKLPKDPAILPLAEIEYLRLPESTDEGLDALSAVVPQQLMAMDIQVAEFKINDEDYGSWKFQLRPTNTGATVSELVAQLRALRISGDLDWRFQDDLHSSRFQGEVKTKTIDKAVQAWGYSPTIKAQSSNIKGDVAWAGSPAEFSPDKLKGELKWHSKKGKLVELEGVTDILRVFGIINFNSLARRLRLDFSDLFQKGYSFDNIRGVFELDKGLVKIKESLVIDGPSAKFKIDGTTNMNSKTLDQELVVVLPLSENIPIAAAIAGVPQVGIPLYILHKAFGNIFERFTSAHYLIKGDWDNPKIELVGVFGNRAEQNSKRDDSQGDKKTADELLENKKLPDKPG